MSAITERVLRLEALVNECGGIKEFRYGDDNYYLNRKHDKWGVIYVEINYSPEKVYMDEDTAVRVCEILNTGEYKIEKI